MGRGLDGFFDPASRAFAPALRRWYPLWRCAVLKDPEKRGLSTFSGGLGEGETPLPIPNREVKPLSADGTWLARAWESRTPPVSSQHTRAAHRAARGHALVRS
jgi:hypothetical protein